MNKKIIVAISILAIVGTAMGIRSFTANKNKYTAVKLAQVEKGDIKAYLSTTGTIKSKHLKNYYGTQGKIKTINVKVGDKVRKGQILLAFEAADMTSTIKQAEIQYDNAVLARKDLNNQNNVILSTMKQLDEQIALLQSKLPGLSGDAALKLQEQLQNLKDQRNKITPVSDEKLKQADNSVALASLAVEQAKERAAQGNDKITADFDGTITAVNLSEGDITMGNQPIIVLQDLSNLKLEVHVSKYDSQKVEVGQEAIIKSGGESYKGKVSFLYPAAQKAMGATGGADTFLAVDIDVLNIGSLKVDFDADVDILFGSAENVIKVPAECITVDKKGRSYVYTLENNRAKEKQVQLGLQSDMEAEVLKGINQGERIVLNPGAAVKDGTYVKESTEVKK